MIDQQQFSRGMKLARFYLDLSELDGANRYDLLKKAHLIVDNLGKLSGFNFLTSDGREVGEQNHVDKA